jgi:GntR family transcriptional regulator
MSTAYNQLARSLRDNIISGKWPGGRKIETERELCGHYGFSRITVRRALQTLEEENLIVRRQGLGTFVNVRPRRKIPIVRGDFAGSITTHAPDGKRTLLARAQMPAGKEYARQFEIPPGEPVVIARRLDLIDNRPVAMDEVIIPLRYANQLDDADWQSFDFIERWRKKQGLVPDYESQVIEAAPAADDLIKWLKVKRGHPLLVETNLVSLSGGQVAAKFVSYYLHEHYQFNSLDRVISAHARATDKNHASKST